MNNSVAFALKADEETLFDNLVWMTSAEAAHYLRISTNALRVAVCRGQINARRFRRKLYFRKNELDRMLETSRFKGGS
jgi:excisionase family DNA binding protein